jgi:hypothetical protein
MEEPILEKLFYGNLCPNTACRSQTQEAQDLMDFIAKHYDKLMEELTDDQKETLEKFEDCYAELTDINERDVFAYGFRLGARIAIEALFPTLR